MRRFIPVSCSHPHIQMHLLPHIQSTVYSTQCSTHVANSVIFSAIVLKIYFPYYNHEWGVLGIKSQYYMFDKISE
jgi:hypothetical protein